MSVVIIDYGSGNLRSAAKAFERAAAGLDRPPPITVTGEPDLVAAADRIVLPGVGAFGDCRAGLARVAGLEAALDQAVRRRGRPFLGICVGMQLMARTGIEHGRHGGLGWIDAVVGPIEAGANGLKIPHMGWNGLNLVRPEHPIFCGLADGSHVYFVHSYVMRPAEDVSLATVTYGETLTALVGKDNLLGCQFHPEKSQDAGLKLIENFLAWRP